MKKIIMIVVMMTIVCSSLVVLAENVIKEDSDQGKAITEYALWESEQRDQDPSFLTRGKDNAKQQEDILIAADKLNEIAQKYNITPDDLRVDAQVSNGISWRGASNDSTNSMEKVVSQAAKDLENNNNNNSDHTQNRVTAVQRIMQQSSAKAEIKLLVDQGYGNLTDEELKTLNQKLSDYFNKYSVGPMDEMRLSWADAVANEMQKRAMTDKTAKDQYDEEQQRIAQIEQNNQNKISGKPSSGVLGNSQDMSTSHTPDEIIQEGDSFLNAGNGQAPINGESLTSASSTLYNILLSIGMFSAIAIGVYLGVKFMTSSVEEKAKVKESLIPYICGCVVIFGAFIIWKLVIGLLSAIG